MQIAKAGQTEKIAGLVKKAKEGNKKSFYHLYVDTWKTVYYILIKKTNNEAEAKTLLNEVYTKVYINIGKLENDMAFIAWLTKITFTTYMDHMRELQKQSVEDLKEDFGDMEETDDEFIPDLAFEKKEVRAMVLKTIDELPDRQRDAVFMFYYQGLSIKEMADITNASENTIYKRLHDAKKTLKSKLSVFIQKGVKLYNMAGFYILHELIQKDIEQHVSKSLGKAVWATIALNLFGENTVIGTVNVLLIKAAVGIGAASAVTFHVLTQMQTVTEMKNTEPPLAIASTVQVPVLSEPTSLQPMEQVQIKNKSLYEEEKEGEIPIQQQVSEAETPTNTIEPSASPWQEIAAEEVSMENPQIYIIESSPESGQVVTDNPHSTADVVWPNPTQEPGEALSTKKPASPIMEDANRVKLKSASFTLKYEVNQVPEESLLIKDIYAYSGNAFDPDHTVVTILENSPEGGKVGTYKVVLMAKAQTQEEAVEINVTIYVVDTIAPVIHIENPELIFPVNVEASLSEIIEKALVTITDNSQESIQPSITGYEAIDFSKGREYALRVNATDSQGNEAMQKNILIKITEG